MLTVYRIFKTKHSKAWFDGEGARQFGGRWNSPGSAVLYSSASLSLAAALEMLVHLDADRLIAAYSYATVTFDEKLLIEVEDFAKIPQSWSDSPPGEDVQEIGDRWLRSNISLVLSVPTVVVPAERNYLFNVGHPDFKKLKFSVPKHFIFDDRLMANR